MTGSREADTQDVVDRKIEKYIAFFITQPRIQGFHSSVRSDLEKLKGFTQSVRISETSSGKWITK